MRKHEMEGLHKDILDKHKDINKFLRAHLIDWLMHVCEVLQKEDNTLPFISVSIMDRYYARVETP